MSAKTRDDIPKASLLEEGKRQSGCTDYHLTRRNLLRSGAGLLALASAPSWLPRATYAASQDSERDIMVSIFLRGGADSLSLCVPFTENRYYSLRPTMAVAPPDSSNPNRAIDLDGRFGLGPSLEPLLPSFENGDLSIVHACGSHDPTRSHFTAMHFMETGQTDPTLFTGWLGRHLQAVPPKADDAFLRAIGIGIGLQRTLAGAPQAVPVNDLSDFDFGGREVTRDDRQIAIEAMYAEANGAMRIAVDNTFRTIELLNGLDIANYTTAGDRPYPEDEFGVSLQSTAALIKAEVGLEAVAIDVGGWDTHDFQGTAQGGRFHGLAAGLAEGLAAFWSDLDASSMRRVTIAVMTEFGRNVAENGSEGTDHGHGSLMLVLSGNTEGGRVHTDWPGLAHEQLYEGQDLAVTIDYRDVLAEILGKRLGSADPAAVFGDPSFTPIDRGIMR